MADSPPLFAPLIEPLRRIRRSLGQDRQPLLWLYALIVGAASGLAAVAFWRGLALIQRLVYGADDTILASRISTIDWWLILFGPAVGGLLVGLILRAFSANGRPESVSHVIEASRLRQGQMNIKQGAVSAAASVISLGFGASAGREGPVVHLGASIATLFTRALRLNAIEARTLLGCAAAAAVAASFNAPIAGALFALEVVLGHYAVRAFAPIVVASAAGTVVSHLIVGSEPTFIIPAHQLATFWELPAFAILGVVSALTATVLMSAIIVAEDFMDRMQARLGFPVWLEPAMGGLALGVIALAFPQILGVGYEATNATLNEDYTGWFMFGLIAAKSLAVAITLASRFGGGVFSPSLMLGALTGGVFGIVATGFAPELSASHGLYALAGMGAVAAAVLGAPISTILIVFELTRGYDALIAVMVSTSLATVVTQQLIERSYFHWRLGRRGLHLGDGPQRYLLETMAVRHIMRPHGEEQAWTDNEAWDLADQGVWLPETAMLSQALPMFQQGAGLRFVPVMSQTGQGEKTVIGALFHTDALRAYNRALVEAHEEEHA